MKNNLRLLLWIVFLSFFSCKKAEQKLIDDGFITYTIPQGEHYSDNSKLLMLSDISELKFIVVFDSSAKYTSAFPENQLDINKLYGFSDNNTQHHENSARIGWRWNENELQLFAYIYNNSVRSFQYIKSVPINDEINCSIKIEANKYIFAVDGTTIEMPRFSTSPNGYKLYPYFGGDEVAPHKISIRIKEIK